MWFKVDDQLAFHRKTLAAGNPAMGLWVRAGSWLRQPGNTRDGQPGVLLLTEARTMGSAAEVKRLIDSGLWHACKVDGAKAVRFHDWTEFQPPADELEAKREAWRGRKKRQRHHSAGDHSLCLADYCDDAPDEPLETDAWGPR